MDSENRIQALEQQVGGLSEQLAQMMALLQSFQAPPPLPPNPPPTNSAPLNPAPQSPELPPTPTGSVKPAPKGRLRPAMPSEFSGDREQGPQFLNSLRTYMRLCPEQFDSEETQIVWALSFMKSGRAGKYALRIMEQENRDGVAKFYCWADFESDFRSEFFPTHPDVDAVTKLEGTTYFQGRRSVDGYLDEFRTLWTDSKYRDSRLEVIKFRRGLDPSIDRQIGTLAFGRPSDTDPEAWFKAALQYDQNRSAQEAFRSSYVRPAAPTPPSRTPLISRAPPPNSGPTPAPRNAHLTPTPGNPVPMDIDANRLRQQKTMACHRCGQTGHLRAECPKRFDIRFLTLEEKQELAEQAMAALDVAAVATELTSELTPEEDTTQEDF